MKLRTSGAFSFVPGRDRKGGGVGKYNFSQMVCIVFVFCAAAVIASPAQTLTTLHSFDSTDAANPFAGLVQATDGNFYGTTYSGGAANNGAVFKVTPSGVFTTLYSFCSQKNCTDGALPVGGLIQYSDGNLYGTTGYGGANNRGTVFKISPQSPYTMTVLYNFCNLEACADGSQPYAGLILGTDGNFYGTTLFGGKNSFGAIFSITPSGALTTLYSFCAKSGCLDGASPSGNLIQAADGKFYGTTQSGGANKNNACDVHGCGTVFAFAGGGLTTLYNFCAQNGCTDGLTPNAGVIQASNGYLYGTTNFGGANNNNGTVFKITTSGALTTLYSFCSKSGCPDGQGPTAGLVQATDGNLYGTTDAGGRKGAGTIYKMNLSGALTTIYTFCIQSGCSDGEGPYAALIQGTDGNFYGTTFIGGAHGYGSVFSLQGPAQFVPVTPCRLVDTRNANGEFGGPPLQGKQTRSFTIPDNTTCNIPVSAVAYSLNVTVSPHGPLGYLTVWPTGQPQPQVSTLNSVDGRVKANAAIVPAGTNGAISFYVTDTADLILDIDGYFTTASNSTLAFYPLTPCRVADTRNPTGPLGGPYLMGDVNRDFPVLEAASCNIPSSAQVYSLNFTAVPHGSLGYLTVCPTPSDPSQNCPVVSTLNAPTGQVTANAAIVPAGANGEIRTYPSNNTDLIIDINGYFAAPGTGGQSLYPVTPCRVLDTRPPSGKGPFQFELNPPVDVLGSPCGVSSNAQAYVFNATVVPQGPLGYLTLWPDGQKQPLVSTLNAYDGIISSNMAIVPASATNGKVDAYANPVNKSDPTDLTNLLLDISSYFAP